MSVIRWIDIANKVCSSKRSRRVIADPILAMQTLEEAATAAPYTRVLGFKFFWNGLYTITVHTTTAPATGSICYTIQVEGNEHTTVWAVYTESQTINWFEDMHIIEIINKHNKEV